MWRVPRLGLLRAADVDGGGEVMGTFLLGAYLTGAAFTFFCTSMLDCYSRDNWKPVKYAIIWPLVVVWKGFVLFLAMHMQEDSQ